MKFVTLITNSAAALFLIAVQAEALAPRDPPLDVTLKWHSTKGCHDSGGDERHYSDGACLPLGDEARGVDILELRRGCYIISHGDSECSTHPRELGNTGCWKLEGKNSVKFQCD